MADTIKTRIISTHDVEETWNVRVAFKPEKGEIIIYDPDADHPYSRFKIGDGVRTLLELPFAVASGISDFLNIENDVCYADGGNITDYIVEKTEEVT